MRLILIAILLSGCAYKDMSRTEMAWQAIHIADVGQTINIKDDPCFEESAPLTRALIGSQPDKDEVIAWGVGMSIGHAYVSKWLDDSSLYPWVKNVIRFVDLTDKVMVVASNHSLGIGTNKTRVANGYKC